MHAGDDPADAKPAGGLEAVASALGAVVQGPGLRRGGQALRQLNQSHGFDCPSCAWPDPEHRSAFEFCENGAKAVAHEATRKLIGADFFRGWSVPRLRDRDDWWLEQQGRLAEPLWRPAGGEHYQPIAWADAFARIADALRALESPDQAVFYTSGRTSNEAAFLYQLLARRVGTNNLPDCSNLCHESSGVGLGDAIGVGKGTVGLPDFELADAIFVIGQNPGSNHPRMLTALQAAKRRGCRIVSVNPLRERGLVRFAHPQEPLGLLGVRSTPLADLHLPVRVGGDVALVRGLAKALFELEAERPGRVLDWSFLRAFTHGFDDYRAAVDATGWEAIETGSGVARAALREAAELYAGAERVIACWAMGITQHRNGVANVQEILNLLLLRGNIGKAGAGPCPVRGHSNVQGDRTVGITERPKRAFLDALAAEFGFEPPRAHGYDVVGAIGALRDGRVRFFFGMGGNFAVASPDAEQTAAALGRCELAVHVATKLNRTHLVAGRESILLPCLGRSERDVQARGPQFVSVEDSMSVVHRSQGRLDPVSTELRSEVAIVAGVAHALLGDRPLDWLALAADYDRVRERIARVVPGFHDYNRRVREPSGFVLPSGARTRQFETPDGRAHFRVHPLPDTAVAPGRFRLTTLRSHDQFNTTIYGHDDRYRGLTGDRRVVLIHPDDLRALGLAEGARVDVTSHFRAETRSIRGFRAVGYDVPRGCAAAYFPEANALVPLDSYAEGSRTPSFKSLEVSIAASQREGSLL